MKPSERWQSFCSYYAARAGLPADLVFRQMMQESQGNPKARSPAGACGLLQLMPATAQELGVSELFDPDQNMRGGTEYLARQVANVKIALGSPTETPDVFRMALAAYNGGFGYVREAIKTARARGLPLDWPHIASLLPSTTVRGRKPDHKQITDYVSRIMPNEAGQGTTAQGSVESHGVGGNGVQAGPA